MCIYSYAGTAYAGIKALYPGMRDPCITKQTQVIGGYLQQDSASPVISMDIIGS